MLGRRLIVLNGKHILRVKTPLCSYKIELERNITILTGDSGIGKTSICRAIRKYNRTEGKCDISVISDCNVEIVEDTYKTASLIIKSVNNSIIIIDEGNEWLRSDEFASIVRGSTNYFVIISRDPLYNLPYSIHSVITLKTFNGCNTFETISEKIFVSSMINRDIKVIVTEGSESGREVYKRLASIDVRDIKGEPEGKSTVYVKARDLSNSGVSCCVIVDGAAFGCEIRRMLNLIGSSSSNVTLWAPESFEWLLLKSGVVRRHNVAELINDPSEYIESSEYMSWEQFFTDLVIEIMKDTSHPYSKSKLDDWYLSDVNLEKFKSVIPDILRRKICKEE